MATRMMEVQEKVFARLNSDTALKETITGIFDYVPEKTVTPYIVFGRVFSTPLDTKTTNGETITAQLEVWSNSLGRKETLTIIEKIENAFTQELTFDTCSIIQQKIVEREVQEQAYGLYLGMLSVEFKIDWEE